MKKFRLLSIILIVIAYLCLASPAIAITNPTGTPPIAFGSGTPTIHKIFYNVYESGDRLLLAESYINYGLPAYYPTDYTASEAYIFQLLSINGTSVIISTTVWQYGDKPVGIYLTKAQSDNLSMSTVGTAYVMRITANPAIFPSITDDVNRVSVTLDSSDWIDQSVATSDPNKNPLRLKCVEMVNNIQAHDIPTYSYISIVSGVTYLSTTYGTNLFLSGVPSLNVFCPSLFQTTSSPMTATAPTSTGTYANTLTVSTNLWTSISDGLTAFGTWVGLPQKMAGGLVLLVLTIGACISISQKTQSGVAPIVLGALFPVVGAYLGLLSLGVIFIFTILVVMLSAWFFLTRGII